jgi:hypothetical protein
MDPFREAVARPMAISGDVPVKMQTAEDLESFR